MAYVTVSRNAPPEDLAGERGSSVVSFDLDAPFNEVVHALMPDREVPGPGFLAQARRNATERLMYLEAHGALTTEEVANFAGSKARNRRQTAHSWATERKIFGVKHDGRTLYPSFQFDQQTRKPRVEIHQALKRLPAGLDGWALALWWVTPMLDGKEWVTPLDVLDDPQRLVRLASSEADAWRADGASGRSRSSSRPTS